MDNTRTDNVPGHPRTKPRLAALGRHQRLRPGGRGLLRAHERPKQLWVRALDEVAFRSLRAKAFPRRWRSLKNHPAQTPTLPRVPTAAWLPADQLILTSPTRAARAALASLAGRAQPHLLAKLSGILMGQRQIASCPQLTQRSAAPWLPARPGQPTPLRRPFGEHFPRALVGIDHTALGTLAAAMAGPNSWGRIPMPSSPLMQARAAQRRIVHRQCRGPAQPAGSRHRHPPEARQRDHRRARVARQDRVHRPVSGLDSLHTQHETVQQIPLRPRCRLPGTN